MRVLVVNAGSSSLKLRLLDGDDTVVAARDLDAREGSVDPGELRAALAADGLGAVDAVGHRVVHGGPDFTAPALVDDGVRARLQALRELAPLHQGAALAAMDAVREGLEAIPAVACFDTAFHATIAEAAAAYALPAEWRERWPLRRYGFHGLSHAHVARRFPDARVVSCHLGSGASLCAIARGASVDTTMGFTPLEGLIMATRSGSVDPGLVLWLITAGGLSAEAVTSGLEHDGGIKGLGGTPDMGALLERARDGDARAAVARDAYLHRLRAAIAAMAAAMDGLDVLIFTGGVGEHEPEIRAGAGLGLRFLGVEIDPARNGAADGEADISGPEARVRTHVLPAREDLEIARQVRSLLGPSARA